MEHNLCDELLKEWCEKMLSLQLTECQDDGLYGGILCPSCSRVHGRCFDAIYPFMYLADTYNDERYLNGAKLLFDWAERVVSREDGSYVNDTNSEWKGTTVFCVIQLAQCLLYHGHILDSDTYNIWIKRLEKAAEFLIDFEGIQNNNVNYRITNALAMHYCSILLNKPKFATVAQESASLAISNFTQKGFLFGEGSPGNGYTKRGCRAVDIGYNVEESLPSLAIYANLTEDDKLKKLLAKSMLTHLEFMLPDGAWDNSFGTRNFKWTYWGSRTSDGCALGYLIMAKENPAFYTAAKRNLNLLHECTQWFAAWRSTLPFGGRACLRASYICAC